MVDKEDYAPQIRGHKDRERISKLIATGAARGSTDVKISAELSKALRTKITEAQVRAIRNEFAIDAGALPGRPKKMFCVNGHARPENAKDWRKCSQCLT